MRTTAVAAFVALLLVSVPAAAQFSPELQQSIQRLNAKPPNTWTSADLAEMAAVTLAMSREMLLSQMSEARRARAANVPVRAVASESGTPAWADEHGIYISEDALGDLILLGTYLGHDVYVEGGEPLQLPPSFVIHPYAVRALLPLLPSLAAINQPNTPQELIRCARGNALCEQPQGFAISGGTVAFVVAHELAHLLLGHEQKKVHSLDEEIAADQEAWRMVMALAPDPREDAPPLEENVRIISVAAPFLVLRWLHDTSTHATDAEAAETRAERLRDIAGDEYFGEPSRIVEPESIPTHLCNVRIDWSEVPDELMIDGVRVAPGDVAGKTLRLLAPAHIFARKNGRFASAQVAGGGTQHVTLDYAAPDAAEHTRDELRELRGTRHWFTLYLATVSSSGQARSEAAAPFFQAAARQIGAATQQALGTWR
jgi:hypothetical protein